jgi:hypothetical protein
MACDKWARHLVSRSTHSAADVPDRNLVMYVKGASAAPYPDRIAPVVTPSTPNFDKSVDAIDMLRDGAGSDTSTVTSATAMAIHQAILLLPSPDMMPAVIGTRITNRKTNSVSEREASGGGSDGGGVPTVMRVAKGMRAREKTREKRTSGGDGSGGNE